MTSERAGVIDAQEAYLKSVVNLVNKITKDYCEKNKMTIPEANMKAIEDEALLEFGRAQGRGDDNQLTVAELLDKYVQATDMIANAAVSDRRVFPPDDTQVGHHSLVEKGKALEKAAKTNKSQLILSLILTTLTGMPNYTNTWIEGMSVTESAAMVDAFRQEPYRLMRIPVLNRLVFVCDEERNATYIFDTVRMKVEGMTEERLASMTKQEAKEYVDNHPGSGYVMVHSWDWPSRFVDLLTSSLERELPQQLSEMRIESMDSGSEWSGFYTDPEGKHWGSISSIANKLSITPKRLEELKAGLSSLTISSGFTNYTGYCYEVIVGLDEMRDLRNVMMDKNSGEFKFIGRTWIYTEALKARYSFSKKTLGAIAKSLAEDCKGLFRTEMAMGVRSVAAFDKEALSRNKIYIEHMEAFANSQNITSFESGFAGFFVIDGAYYGTVSQICAYLDENEKYINRPLYQNDASLYAAINRATNDQEPRTTIGKKWLWSRAQVGQEHLKMFTT